MSLEDLGDNSSSDRSTAITDGKSEASIHGHRQRKLHRCLEVVPGHDHLSALLELDLAIDVCCPEEELGHVLRGEGRVPAALLLGQSVDLGLESLTVEGRWERTGDRSSI